MAYTEKKYNRINWRNSPSTATAVGATNLNRMDVFLNEVDNALITMEAAKLNIATANSMIASITFDKDKGLMTVRELNGTTYTYDWNVEKIPVSFSLSEDGILTMTTQDGTQFTANIADLIKDYVFDDSDTIAFTKEFRAEDDAYHIGASVKNGSIKAEHLDPDYKADIQNFSNVAQTAANDALTYSKASKRWAVGDSSFEGSATDNSKYYKEQAEAAKIAAEKARDEASLIAGVDIATTQKAGIVKPDGVTISVDEDGTIHGPQKFEADGYVYVTGESAGEPTDPPTLDADKLGGELPDKYVKKTDLVTGFEQSTPGQKAADAVAAKELKGLIDQISQKVLNDLVSNESLTRTLAGYVTKSMMSNVQTNDQNKVPTSALVNTMQNAISKNTNDITKLNSEIIQSSGSTPAIKGNTCTITTIKIKAGHRYIILGKAATNAGNSSIMSCKIQVDSGIAKTTGGSDTRTTMESGGGCVNWMYAEPQTDSVIALRGYGYANIEYNYEGILLGLQLK